MSSSISTTGTQHIPSIGQAVRVRLPLPAAAASGGAAASACRATVSYVNNADDAVGSAVTVDVDVVYEEGAEWAAGMEEESGVSLDRLLPLEGFEREQEGEGEEGKQRGEDASAAMAAAARARGEANALFRLGDYGAALARYRLALRRLLLAEGRGQMRGDGGGEGGCCGGLRVGAAVLVHAAPDPSAAAAAAIISSKRAGRLLCRVRRATVADVDLAGGTVDVIYDDEEEDGDSEEEEEEDGVRLSRVVPLPLPPAPAAPSAAVEAGRLLLNIGRVYLKSPLGRLHEALRSVGFAVAALEGVVRAAAAQEEEDAELGAEARRLLVSAYEVRVGALCRGGFFTAAREDVRRLARAGGAGAGIGERVRRLEGEIEAAGVQLQKENRRLAKSMSRWLSRAMEEGGGGGGGGEAGRVVGAGGGGAGEAAGCVCS